MLFKSALQQSSRWNLDDTDGDDPNVSVKKDCIVPHSVISAFESHDKVIFLHNKLCGLIISAPKTLLDNIRVSLRTDVKIDQYTSLDGYDQKGEVDTHELVVEVPVYTIKSSVVVALPAIDVEMCGKFAKSVVSHTSEVLVFTPGQLFGPPICAVYSPNAQRTNLPTAEPPTIIQGATAAVLSAAQQQNKPATGIVVQADGTAGHEAMQNAHIDAVHKLLFDYIGLQVKLPTREMSNLYL